MKLNLRKKNDETEYCGVTIYKADKEVLVSKANEHGLKVSDVMRSLINDYVDGNITIEL